ncbi:MAG: hypothetical protein FJ284_03065 [Planctomycetes bacterium]|nr:hypothetical protein [Planctomycetota bacterium]
MPRTNPLQPPRPFSPGAGLPAAVRPKAAGFVTADAFDGTGILAGVDPSESRYWWLPELYAPEGGVAISGGDQATSRAVSRESAAA